MIIPSPLSDFGPGIRRVGAESGHSLRARWQSGGRKEAVVQPVNQSGTHLIDTKGRKV